MRSPSSPFLTTGAVFSVSFKKIDGSSEVLLRSRFVVWEPLIDHIPEECKILCPQPGIQVRRLGILFLDVMLGNSTSTPLPSL